MACTTSGEWLDEQTRTAMAFSVGGLARAGHADHQPVRPVATIGLVFEVDDQRGAAGLQPDRNLQQRLQIHRLTRTDGQHPRRPQRVDVEFGGIGDAQQRQHVLRGR